MNFQLKDCLRDKAIQFRIPDY